MRKSGSKISVSEYYEKFQESQRLKTEMGKLEYERTKEILLRFLPPGRATVLDVGGGSGPYSSWLAKRGHTVYLIEPSFKLLKVAHRRSRNRWGRPLFDCRQGDAHALDFAAGFADAVLLFGPLYHLTGERDRQLAFREAHRVLKKNGLVFCAAISRFASAIDGLVREYFKEEVFFKIILQDLSLGQHRNPTDQMEFFTDAYFHRPSDLKAEIEQAGFSSCQVFPVEGLGIFLRNFDAVWNRQGLRRRLLDLIGRTEHEDSILGVSPHLMGVARKTVDTMERKH